MDDYVIQVIISIKLMISICGLLDTVFGAVGLVGQINKRSDAPIQSCQPIRDSILDLPTLNREFAHWNICRNRSSQAISRLHCLQVPDITG